MLRKWEGGQLFGYCWKWKQETSEKERRGETSKFRQKPFRPFRLLLLLLRSVLLPTASLSLAVSSSSLSSSSRAVDLSTSACQSGGRGRGVGLPSLGNRTLYFLSRNPRPLPPLPTYKCIIHHSWPPLCNNICTHSDPRISR